MKFYLSIRDNADNPVIEINTYTFERLEEEFGSFSRSQLCKDTIKEEMTWMAEAMEADKEVRRELEMAQLTL